MNNGKLYWKMKHMSYLWYEGVGRVDITIPVEMNDGKNINHYMLPITDAIVSRLLKDKPENAPDYQLIIRYANVYHDMQPHIYNGQMHIHVLFSTADSKLYEWLVSL